MTAFASNGTMKGLRTQMGIGSVTVFSSFFDHVRKWAKCKPTDGTTYGITAKGFTSKADLPACYNNSQNDWTFNAIATSNKKLTKFVGYDHDISGPVSGVTVNKASVDNGSSSTFTVSLDFYSSTAARISLADIVGSTAKLGVYCVGQTTAATFHKECDYNIGHANGGSVAVSTHNRNAEKYYIYLYITDGTKYYTIPDIGRSEITITQYVAPIELRGLRIAGYPQGGVFVGDDIYLTCYADYYQGNTLHHSDDVSLSNETSWGGYSGCFWRENKKFHANTAGYGDITVSYGNYQAQQHFTVSAVEVSSIEITTYSSSMSTADNDETWYITAHWNNGSTTYPSNDNNITWESSDPAKATVGVHTGVVHPVSGGQTVIKATYGGRSNSKTLTVTVPSVIPVSSVTVDPDSWWLLPSTQQRTYTKQLTANVSPSNATDKTIKWTTSNRAVARVSSSGLVTSAGEGTAIITATAQDGSGKYGTCTITVSEDAM